jgi:large subunit ribosomal protein LP0
MAEERVYSARKVEFCDRLKEYLNEHKNILIVHADHVGSNQLQQIRIELRGQAVILMGKNTMMRRVVREAMVDNPKLEALLPHIQSNIGLVFTNNDLKHIRDVVLSNQMPASARPGVVAPTDVFIQAGPTGQDPGQTSFFQALNIPTKIVKGCIEITNVVHLIKKGDKVGTSEVALLNKLNVRPFSYGLVIKQIYDNGSVYSADVLDLGETELLGKFSNAVSLIAALGLHIGYPTLATLPHQFAYAFKTLLAVAVETEYSFKEAEKFKEYLANPDAFATAAAPAAKEEAVAPAAAESEEESDEDGDLGGLFD